MRDICPLIMTHYQLQPGSTEQQAASDQGDSFWIFELDNYGNILHCSGHAGTFVDQANAGADGANFFEDVDGLGNMAELQKRFRSFWTSGRPTETFSIYGGYAAIDRPVKVRLTKTFQNGARNRLQTVMMEIKGDPFSKNLGGKDGNTANV